MFGSKTQPALPELIRQKLKQSFEIRPFPQIVLKLSEMVKNPDVDFKQIGKLIESDAALCSRVFRMANSPMIGCRDQVSRIEHAIALMGLGRIRSLVHTHAAAAVFSGNGLQKAEFSHLWKHSLAVAITARKLAERGGEVDSNAAFLAGIFHDVGQLFFFEVAHEAYQPLSHNYYGIELTEHEHSLFGLTHPEIGNKLAIQWNLPEDVRVAISYHEDPQQAIAHEKLTLLVHLADTLADAWGIGRETIMQPQIDQRLKQMEVSLDHFQQLKEPIEMELLEMS